MDDEALDRERGMLVPEIHGQVHALKGAHECNGVKRLVWHNRRYERLAGYLSTS